MGYDLHITRKDDWSDGDGPVIAETEWRAVIDADSALTLDTDTKHDDWVFAAWRSQAGVLAYHDGEIVAKDPDEPLIWKMVEIAGRLNARVKGDDGEQYPSALKVAGRGRVRSGSGYSLSNS